MKVYILIGITKERDERGINIAHCLLASYTKSSCEKKIKQIKNSHLNSFYESFYIDEKPIKRTNNMVAKELDDKIDFHNGMVRRGR